MSGRDSYPIFERDNHGFPIRVRWVDRNSVPAAFVGGAIIPRTGAFAIHRGRLHESTCSCSDPNPAADPESHGAT